MIFGEDRISVRVDIYKTFYKEFRALLFRNNVSFQEFFNHIIQLAATGDLRIHEILINLKKESIKNKTITATDSESIYSIIESESPFSEKE